MSKSVKTNVCCVTKNVRTRIKKKNDLPITKYLPDAVFLLKQMIKHHQNGDCKVEADFNKDHNLIFIIKQNNETLY